MIYLSQVLGIPVIDATGSEIGKVSDLAISTGEVFPHITSLAFLGPDKTPFMVSWRKYVKTFDDDKITLDVEAHNIRFSYLQPDEILLARDLLNKQIVDTQGMKVVRVNDLKLSQSYTWLRLIGAEVGIRGLLRALSPRLERAACALGKLFHQPLEENIIAWNYIELVDRDLSQVKLSVSHKRLHELHPADIADILEQLDPKQRALVFDHLDNQHAADTVAELEDDVQSDLIEDMSEHRASELLAQMDPDDAADIIGGLPYDKAETLLWLMGVQDQHRIRALLGYKEKSAGGIMTTDVLKMLKTQTVAEAIQSVRDLGEEYDSIHYVYIVDNDNHLFGTVSLRQLVLANEETKLEDIAATDLFTVSPDIDQEEVVEAISKYDLLAIPVIDENKRLLGIVTVDDAFDVLEEEHDEDLMLAGAKQIGVESGILGALPWFFKHMLWIFVWIITMMIVFALPPSASAVLSVPQLVVMPVVLVFADIIGSFAINRLIEYDNDETLVFSKLLGHNLVISLIVATIFALLSFAILSILGANLLGTQGTISFWIPIALPALISIIATAIIGAIVSWVAIRMHKKDKLISDVSVSLVLMISAVLVQLGSAILVINLWMASIIA